ncbi:MAG: VOC family protein, partial [candidate division NC10 bacterium]|nr:VOC family protein [candidate division NC10 bacterium]
MAIVSGFNHASFTVSDMDRSLLFYRDLLGMTLEADRELQAPH